MHCTLFSAYKVSSCFFSLDSSIIMHSRHSVKLCLVSLGGELEGQKIKSCWLDHTHWTSMPGFYFLSKNIMVCLSRVLESSLPNNVSFPPWLIWPAHRGNPGSCSLGVPKETADYKAMVSLPPKLPTLQWTNVHLKAFCPNQSSDGEQAAGVWEMSHGRSREPFLLAQTRRAPWRPVLQPFPRIPIWLQWVTLAPCPNEWLKYMVPFWR